MKVTYCFMTFALAVSGLTACGGNGDGAEGTSVVTTTEVLGATTDPADNTSEPAVTAPGEASTTPSSSDPTDDIAEPTAGPAVMDLELVDCEQFAMVALVDGSAAQSLVPDEHEVLVDADGLATLTHVAKTCGDLVVDGTALGAGHFNTQWITITGPDDQRTYAEYPEHLVLPTDYLYPINFHTDNAEFSEAVGAFGTPMALADSIEMEPLGPGMQSGSLVADDGYSWSVDNITAVDQPVYFVHILEHAEQSLEYRYEIECPATVLWWEGAARLEPVPGSALHEAFGPEIVGLGFGVDLSCAITIDRTLEITVAEDIDYTETKQLDVYAPASGSEWPVVVFFHGGDPTGDPEKRKTVAEAPALAAQGLVVYVPHWRSNGPSGGSQDAVCAVAFAEETAEDYGGNADRVTLSGYSSGGMIAATHALIGDEPPLEVTDCLVDPTMNLPGAAVVGGTPFFVVDAARAGAYNWAEWDLTPEQLDAFDPYLALGRNPDVRFVLVVGENDTGGGILGEIPIAESNLEYFQALIDAGYDAELVLLPGGHLEPMNPTTDQFDTWVKNIADTAHASS